MQESSRGRAEVVHDGEDGEGEGAAAYVHVLAGEPSDEDVAMLRRARRAPVPVVAVAFASAINSGSLLASKRSATSVCARSATAASSNGINSRPEAAILPCAIGIVEG